MHDHVTAIAAVIFGSKVGSEKDFEIAYDPGMNAVIACLGTLGAGQGWQ